MMLYRPLLRWGDNERFTVSGPTTHTSIIRLVTEKYNVGYITQPLDDGEDLPDALWLQILSMDRSHEMKGKYKII